MASHMAQLHDAEKTLFYFTKRTQTLTIPLNGRNILRIYIIQITIKYLLESTSKNVPCAVFTVRAA